MNCKEDGTMILNEDGTMINNIPMKTKKYVIARFVGGEYWFYDTTDNEDLAYRIAIEVNGRVFEF